MKKWLVIVVIALVVLIGAAVTSLWLLPVKHKTTLVNHLLEPYQLSVERVDYTPPYQLQVEGLRSIEYDLYLPSATVWLNPSLVHNRQIIIDSVLIEGIQLNDRQQLRSLPVFNPRFLEQVKFHQLALKHVDIDFSGWILRDASLQIAEPTWRHQHQWLPYGDIQFQADQVYIEGEALNNALLHVVHQPEKSTVYGASFEWNEARFSGQAERLNDQWSLANVTINQLNLDLSEEDSMSHFSQLIEGFEINYINSLDLINSQIITKIAQAENLNLSIESIQLDQPLSNQQQGYLSFDADLLVIDDLSFVSPRSRVNFSPQLIEIEEWDSDLWQGRVQVSGLWSPVDLKLNKLHISGIKLLEQTEQAANELISKFNKVRNLSIKDLAVSRSQLVQVEQAPFWQLSGLNIRGSDMVLKQDGAWGLWQGQTELSVNSASFDTIIATQGIVELATIDQKMQLKRLFIPLEQGYLDASGTRHLTERNQPWQLDFTIDGLPFSALEPFTKLPFDVEGLLDIQGDLKGLSSDWELLRYSIDGHIDAGLRSGRFQHHASVDGQDKTLEQDFELDGFYANFNRGRMSFDTKQLSGPNLSGQFRGLYDWVEPKATSVLLELAIECEQWQIDLLSGDTQIEAICHEAN